MAHHQPPPRTAAKVEWIDSAPLAMGVVRDGVLIFVNERLANLVGRDASAMLGESVFDFVVAEDRPRVEERHNRRLKGELVPDSYEFSITRADGSRRLVEIFVQTDADDEVVFQLADRTPRMHRSESLHALARLGAAVQMHQTDRAVLAAVGAGLSQIQIAWVRLVPDGDVLRVEALSFPFDIVATYEKISGHTALGSRGQWVPELLAAWNEGSAYVDDVPLTSARFLSDASSEHARSITQEHDLIRGVVLRVDAAGAPAALLWLMAPWILPEDVPAFALFATQVSAALDAARVISDLSNRNAELAALNRIASAAGSERDLSSLFGVGADELDRVLGCVSITIHLIEENFATLAYEHNTARFSLAPQLRMALEQSAVSSALSAGRAEVWTRKNAEAKIRERMEERAIDSVATVPLIARREPIGLLTAAFTRLATERELKIMEAAAAHFAAAVEAYRLFENLRTSYGTLARTQQQLVHRERLAAIGELAAVVAHEVRNPLGVIFNSVGAIRRMLGEIPHALTIVDILDEDANRLNHIVGDLLDFAKPATPSLHGERIDTILDAAAEAALGESRPHVIVVKKYEALPTAKIDARLMRQAFVNIVLNAVQAMPRGGHLTLSLTATRGGAVIEIGDSGTGIPADVLPRIFEPFFTTRATGTGLGLAVVKRIIDGHRGEISVFTDPAGTTFTVRVPLDPDDVNAAS